MQRPAQESKHATTMVMTTGIAEGVHARKKDAGEHVGMTDEMETKSEAESDDEVKDLDERKHAESKEVGGDDISFTEAARDKYLKTHLSVGIGEYEDASMPLRAQCEYYTEDPENDGLTFALEEASQAQTPDMVEVGTPLEGVKRLFDEVAGMEQDETAAAASPAAQSDVEAVLKDLDQWARVDRRLLDELGLAEATLEQEQTRFDESEALTRMRAQCDQLRLRTLEAEGRAVVASESLARLEASHASLAEVRAMFSAHEKRLEAVVLSSVASALEGVRDGLRHPALLAGGSERSLVSVASSSMAAPAATSGAPVAKSSGGEERRREDIDESEAEDVAELHSRIEALEATLAAKSKDLDATAQREFALIEKLKAAELVGHTARAQYEEAVQELREDMKARLTERQTAEARRISTLEQEVEKLSAVVETRDGTIREAQEELDRLRRETEAESRAQAAQVDRLTLEKATLESNVHDAQLELARIKHDLATRRSDEDDLLARLAAFQASQIAAASPPNSPRGARSSSTVAASLSAWWQSSSQS